MKGRPSLKVTMYITRLDLITLPWKLWFRLRANQFLMLGMWIFVFKIALQEPESGTTGDIGASALGATMGVAVGMVCFLALNSVYAFLAPFKNKGVLGRHDLALSPDAFRESTDVNESSYRWVSISRVFRLRRSLIIQLNSLAVCPIPRRAFDSKQDFEAFCAYAENAWRTARLAERGGKKGRPEPEGRG